MKFSPIPSDIFKLTGTTSIPKNLKETLVFLFYDILASLVLIILKV